MLIRVLLSLLFLLNSSFVVADTSRAKPTNKPINILLAITDDHSFEHLSVNGSTFVNTPNIDKLAQEGFAFTNAYAASTGCSPSRAALLTGQHHWMLGAAGTHGSSFPAHYQTFVDILEEHGYKVGFTGKGWGPGSWHIGGRIKNPAGVEYNNNTLNYKPVKGISKIDYAENFKQFLTERDESQPFSFWFGAREPHLKYQEGPRTADELENVTVPGFMPDTYASRSMLLDYADEINHFDTQLGKMLVYLEEVDELDNTLIIMTADNGMPMPRAKSNGYDYGVHVPLVIRWANSLKKGQVIKGTVGFVDLSSTILEAAGVPVPEQFVGKSLMGLLNGTIEQLDYSRSVFAGRERHSSSRYNNMGYPQRIMRQGDYLLIWNAKPDRHPAGAPKHIVEGQLEDAFFDIDNSVAKRELLTKKEDSYVSKFYHLAIDKRPDWEFFNVTEDPYNLANLADDVNVKLIFEKHKKRLLEELIKTDDLRLTDYGDLWQDFPRVSEKHRYFPTPSH